MKKGWNRKLFLASLSGAILCSAFALCQSSASFSSGPEGMHGTMHFGPPFSRVATIAGAPFSAEEVDEDQQTLADGTSIHHTRQGKKIYRDSLGRTRTEYVLLRGPIERHVTPEGPTIVEIIDPVAHVSYIFDLDEPIAHRQELVAHNPRGSSARAQVGHAIIGDPPGMTAVAGDTGDDGTMSATTTVRAIPPSAAKRRGPGDEKRPQMSTEKLGTQIIEGIPAEGTKTTMTWPVGSVGNDRPIVSISESWTSPDLKEIILRESDDPRSGERTHKLVNISRSEPDASLFEPPPGYTVKDEEREFTIDWNPMH